MSSALKILEESLHDAGINYEFREWTASISYPYWVGTYNEIESMNEDGYCELNITLMGHTRGMFAELQNDRDTIEDLFPRDYGMRIATDDGIAVILYANTLADIPTGDAELKRMQINLTIKEWKE